MDRSPWTEFVLTDNPLAVNLGDATPRRLLVEWANRQDAWIRELVAETILSRQESGDDILGKVYRTFLAEKGLSGRPQPEVPPLVLDPVEPTQDDSLELTSLHHVEHVNALAADQSLEFDADLTVLFGQNGSGKTGYARILKRISAVRTPEDILPNAHTHATVGAVPSAQIEYRLSGHQHTVEWKDEAGLAPFTRISVFDAAAVSLHVDSDLGYVYTPAELALFSHVAAGIRGIQQLIGAEVAELKPGANPLLARFARGTTIYPMIETLGATSDLAELGRLATVEGDAEAQRDRLQGEVEALRANTLDALLTNAQQSHRDLARLAKVLHVVAEFDIMEYGAAREALSAAQQRRTATRELLFTPTELPGAPDEEWQRFVVAADNYRQHLGAEHYPQTGDTCLYCTQELSPLALDLVGRYRTFLDEAVTQQLAAAQDALRATRLPLDGPDLVAANEFATMQAAVHDAPPWAAPAATALRDAHTVLRETTSGQALTRADVPADAAVLLPDLDRMAAEAEQVAATLTHDKTNATTLMALKQRALAELTARIELARNLSAATEYVRRAKRADQLDKLSKVISNGAAKQLTIQSKLASEDLVNKNFEGLFVDECARLRAPGVALTFQGRSGQAQRKKVVATYKPSSVLSEGEQKVLAIADFLAESRMRETKAPLVFDDPVTSLDYRRLDEVASRIQQLAETHQVIVLTHNIMFASALISARQNKKQRAKIYEVRDGGNIKGILAPDVEPRLDTAADLAKRINTKLQAIPGAEPVLQDALIKETYDLIRAWCEAFVEQELLQNVTQRYRANVMMTRLSKIDTTRLDAAVAVIEPLFARACDRMTGHSHAAEYMCTKPTAEEVQEDWEKAKAARSAYLA
jgi:energy-coupling factor transporter ATP-binding protein EcfA2